MSLFLLIISPSMLSPVEFFSVLLSSLFLLFSADFCTTWVKNIVLKTKNPTHPDFIFYFIFKISRPLTILQLLFPPLHITFFLSHLAHHVCYFWNSVFSSILEKKKAIIHFFNQWIKLILQKCILSMKIFSLSGILFHLGNTYLVLVLLLWLLLAHPCWHF